MPRPDEAELSLSSRRWLADTDLTTRKRRGQYLTPRPVADALVSRVEARPRLKVLDPGVGTGEILAAVARRFPDAELTGWDVDATVLDAARELVPAATLELRSALEPPVSAGRVTKAEHLAESAGGGSADPGSFDLVIGNPPYFQVPVTPELKRRFGEVISGRANIFALFFKAGLDLLAPGGTLAYVVPPSMNSGAYFEALREHIVTRASIADLTVLEGSGLFEGANTAAQLLVLRKGDHRSDRSDFVFEHSEPEADFRRVVFTRLPDELRAGFDGRRTLWQLGFEAVTGTVVWNQRRSDLRKEAGPSTVPLIWSRDLRGGKLDLPKRDSRAAPEKPGYLSSDRRLAGPALLVNRVVGAVGRGALRTCLVPEGIEFLAENHVNVIRTLSSTSGRVATADGNGSPRLGWQELQVALEAPGTGDRARLLTGNTQLSATELTHLLPV